ncbi:hypothetical protein SMD20_09050 [Nonomuraea sp. LP-02]|uniref:hypothetical protein n=1 Tax=Nonomuraea sp. LP-02 TaxID=3097960 RepID=UPI002E372A74|nr:hypothetical protein [Nonomuraea sp. LP-02]MED7924377.1 hypothetical protein [Nonomuraea sp. LP-02]
MVGERRSHLLKPGAGQRGRPASVAPFGFRRSDALGGQLVLQVALELPGGGDDVDEQRGRRVVGGEVVEVGQWSGQDVAGVRGGGDLGERGPISPERIGPP